MHFCFRAAFCTLILPKYIFADTHEFSLSLYHSTFVQGNQTNFEIRANGVDATQLYPEVKYTTIDEYLNQFVLAVDFII